MQNNNVISGETIAADIITSLKESFKQTYTTDIGNAEYAIVILTGGLSHLFKDAIKSKAFIDEDITIKGLIQIAKNDKHLNTYA